MKHVALGCLLVLLCTGPVQAASVYKWLDNRGVVQYTETPPPGGIPYEVLRRGRSSVTSAPAGQAAAAEPAEETDDAEFADDFDESTELTDSDETDATDPDGDPAQSTRAELFARNCATARTNLATLESDQPVVIRGTDGRAVLINDEERTQRTAEARRDIEYYCSDATTAESN